MPGMNGLEVQSELASRGVTLPVVVVSGSGDLDAAVEAMKLGAVDYLRKPVSEDKLLEAVAKCLEDSAANERSRGIKLAASATLGRLSTREMQLLQGLLGGSSNKEIARRLDLSPRTVEMHRASMMHRLGVSKLSEALRIAIDAGLKPLA
jgi:FixJ family two-component response regulator